MIEMLIRLWMDGCLRGNKIFREISKRNKTFKISRNEVRETTSEQS